MAAANNPSYGDRYSDGLDSNRTLVGEDGLTYYSMVDSAQSKMHSALMVADATLTGAGDLGGNVFGGLFGVSVSKGYAVDILNAEICGTTTACAQFGIGVYGGVGVNGSGGVSFEALQSGNSETWGIFGNVGVFGASAGGSIDFGGGATAAKSFLGAGQGISGGLQFCRTTLECEGQ